MISRRDFLKLVPTTLASMGMIGLPEAQRLSGGPNQLLKGANLKGWTTALGDGIYARPGEAPVTLADIQTVHFPTYSELRANVQKRVIMAHNITSKKIVDPDALKYIHTCTYKYCLPYLPTLDINAALNGETVEGGIFVWDGRRTKLDYGIAFQWVVNPWASDSGAIRTWADTEWITVGHLAVDTAWHTVKMIVDFRRKTSALFIDGKQYLVRYTKTKKTGWGTTVDARFQLEIISIYPEPDGIRATHKAQFKNWSWLWEPA